MVVVDIKGVVEETTDVEHERHLNQVTTRVEEDGVTAVVRRLVAKVDDHHPAMEDVAKDEVDVAHPENLMDEAMDDLVDEVTEEEEMVEGVVVVVGMMDLY
jgi:glycine cleavage system pyridoxal-binding protein P